MFACRIALTLIAFASLPAIGSAHPGHGNHRDANGLLHYVTSPLHVLPVLVAAIVFAGIAFLIRKSSRLNTAQLRR